jgi:hypothetical protein
MTPLPRVVAVDAEPGRVTIDVGDRRVEVVTLREGDMIVATAVTEAS